MTSPTIVVLEQSVADAEHIVVECGVDLAEALQVAHELIVRTRIGLVHPCEKKSQNDGDRESDEEIGAPRYRHRPFLPNSPVKVPRKSTMPRTSSLLSTRPS